MKPSKILFYILMFLPLLITLIALPFLPDQIPAHYNSHFEVTRWGSKYETLIFPSMILFMGYFLLAITKIVAKQETNSNTNETICMITGIATFLLFNAMTYYFLYIDFHLVENLSFSPTNLYEILFGILGVCMIIIGTVMPKLHRNSLIGLRTPWSLKNEVTWKKSQRFGGISFIISGIVLIFICLFTTGFSCFLWGMITIVMVGIIDVIYTFHIAQQN